MWNIKYYLLYTQGLCFMLFCSNTPYHFTPLLDLCPHTFCLMSFGCFIGSYWSLFLCEYFLFIHFWFSPTFSGCKTRLCCTCTGWGKITSINFKVNNKKTIRDTKILFLDSETTTWEVLNHIVFKRISCKWWPLFVCRAPGRLQNESSDSLDVLWCSRGLWSSSSFFRHTSRFPEVLNPQQNGFSVRYSVPREDLVASTERMLHRYDRVTLQKVGFDGKCAQLIGPHHLYNCGVL